MTHRLPGISPFRTLPEGGGMMSYGPNLPTLYRTLTAAGAMAGVTSCSSEFTAGSHETVADRTWRHGNVTAGDRVALMHELVRYATLAPSDHNTQCWKFRLENRAISIEFVRPRDR